jgi:ribokinase
MVGASGNNAILVEPGANQRVPLTLKPEFAPGDLFIAQYETNGVAHYIKMAREGGLRTLLNPSPFRADSEAIALADYVIVNAVELSQLVSEGAAATGRAAAGSAATDSAAAAAVAASASRQLGCAVIATLGRQGAVLAAGGDAWAAPGYAVHAADTQGAGDTFIGFFAASLLRGLAPPRAMLRAVIAASMSVRMRGSAQRSFPDLGEVDSEFGRLLKAGKPTNLWNRGNGNEK